MDEITPVDTSDTFDVHDYLDEKRVALEKWAAHLEGIRL